MIYQISPNSRLGGPFTSRDKLIKQKRNLMMENRIAVMKSVQEENLDKLYIRPPSQITSSQQDLFRFKSNDFGTKR